MQYSIIFNNNPKRGALRTDLIVYKSTETNLMFTLSKDITGLSPELRVSYTDYTPISSYTGSIINATDGVIEFGITTTTTPPVDDWASVPVGEHIYQVILNDATTGAQTVERQGEFRVRPTI